MVKSRNVRLGVVGSKPHTWATLETTGGFFVFRPEEWIEPVQQVDVIRDPDGHVTGFSEGSRRGVVADFKPRPLWGEVEGEPFTVLDARMSTVIGWKLLPAQVYEAGSILWGAHVDAEEASAEAIRVSFSIRGAGWAGCDPMQTEQGRISPWSSERGSGLTWEPKGNHTIYSLRQGFPPIPRALLQLWTEEEVEVQAIQVRLPVAGWCAVESPGVSIKKSPRSWLPLNKLDMGLVARWIELAAELGPIPFIALGDKAPLQPEAQLIATALEGLHRRLHPERRRFQATKNQCKKARQAAVAAAAEVFKGVVEEDVVSKAYREALGHVQDLSYAERLEELLPPVEVTAPGLLGPSRSAWIKDMGEARNTQSHGLDRDDELDDAGISRYYVLASSGRWALKILLLRQLVSLDVLRSSLWDSDRFMYALANIDREHFWSNFSAYEHFTAHAKESRQAST